MKDNPLGLDDKAQLFYAEHAKNLYTGLQEMVELFLDDSELSGQVQDGILYDVLVSFVCNHFLELLERHNVRKGVAMRLFLNDLTNVLTS